MFLGIYPFHLGYPICWCISHTYPFAILFSTKHMTSKNIIFHEKILKYGHINNYTKSSINDQYKLLMRKICMPDSVMMRIWSSIQDRQSPY